MEQWREELYLGELYHSKGPWKTHKYIKKIGNRYIYPGMRAISDTIKSAQYARKAKAYGKSNRLSVRDRNRSKNYAAVSAAYGKRAKDYVDRGLAPIRNTAAKASRAVRDEYRRQRNKAAGKAYTRSVISKQNARKRRQAINNAVNDTKKRVGAKLSTMGAIASNRANLASFAVGKAYRQARTAYRNARNKAAIRRNTNAAIRRQRRRK